MKSIFFCCFLLQLINLNAYSFPFARHTIVKYTPPTSKYTKSRTVITLASVPRIASTIVNSLTYHKSNKWYVWTLLSLTSTIGLYSEKTDLGAMISSPLVTMCITLIMCNLGLLPLTSPNYDTVMKLFVPLAIPLLLMDADIRKCIRSTGDLLKAFIVGSIGTLLGTIVAYILVPMRGMKGSETVAAALCARHIGGAINFVAVSEALKTPAEVVTAAIAADNVIIALYFAFLFSLCPSEPAPTTQASDRVTAPETASDSSINIQTLSAATSLAFVLCAAADLLAPVLSINSIVLVSAMSVAAATFSPKLVGSLAPAGAAIGGLLMQMFFAVTGASGHIPTVIRVAPALALHSAVQILVHLGFLLSVGKLLRLPLKELVLASNANVGGPTTAAAMASNKGWKALVLPSLLTGVFGYAIATLLGISMGSVVLPALGSRLFRDSL